MRKLHPMPDPWFCCRNLEFRSPPASCPAIAAGRSASYMNAMADPKSDDPKATGDGSAAAPSPPENDPVQYSNRSIHDVVQQQIAELLADADISEEDRQRILIAMSCPCCGAGGLSFSIELKGKSGPARF